MQYFNPQALHLRVAPLTEVLSFLHGADLVKTKESKDDTHNKIDKSDHFERTKRRAKICMSTSWRRRLAFVLVRSCFQFVVFLKIFFSVCKVEQLRSVASHRLLSKILRHARFVWVWLAFSIGEKRSSNGSGMRENRMIKARIHELRIGSFRRWASGEGGARTACRVRPFAAGRWV